MPGHKGFVSKAQARKIYELEKEGKISHASVERMEAETKDFRKLPNKVSMNKATKNKVKKAMKVKKDPMAMRGMMKDGMTTNQMPGYRGMNGAVRRPLPVRPARPGMRTPLAMKRKSSKGRGSRKK